MAQPPAAAPKPAAPKPAAPKPAAPAAAPAKAEPTKAPAAAAPTTAAAAAAPTKAPEPTKAAAEASITFHSRGGPPTGQEVILYEEQMPLFMKKFPNIKVKHEGFTGEDYVKKVTVLLASNSIGDAMWTAIGDGSIYNFAAMKAIIALDDDQKLRWALAAVPSVRFYRYQVSFKLIAT